MEVNEGENIFRIEEYLGMRMVYIHGGSFLMGASPEERANHIKNFLASVRLKFSDDFYTDFRDQIERDAKDPCDRANPTHHVVVSDYWIGTSVVTQAQWGKVMGTINSQMECLGDCPMQYVSWDEAQEFCNKLSLLTGKHYRLPTEAEWEYAARGGHRNKNNKQAMIPILGMPPRRNTLGLFYNMNGDVGEWCQDWFGEYISKNAYNPLGPLNGSERVLRGRDRHFPNSRIWNRWAAPPSERKLREGFCFRVVLDEKYSS